MLTPRLQINHKLNTFLLKAFALLTDSSTVVHQWRSQVRIRRTKDRLGVRITYNSAGCTEAEDHPQLKIRRKILVCTKCKILFTWTYFMLDCTIGFVRHIQHICIFSLPCTSTNSSQHSALPNCRPGSCRILFHCVLTIDVKWNTVPSVGLCKIFSFAHRKCPSF
jgi:hypothetical protein